MFEKFDDHFSGAFDLMQDAHFNAPVIALGFTEKSSSAER